MPFLETIIFVTLVYCLLNDKTRPTYHCTNRTMTSLRFCGIVLLSATFLSTLGQSFQTLSRVGSDPYYTIRVQFPNSTHKGCYFRFSQAIWKKVQEHGLPMLYSADLHVQKFMIRMMMALTAIRPALRGLLEAEVYRRFPALTQLAEYFTRTWMDGEFPHIMWNVYDANIRTNNYVERWHSKLNWTIRHKHPNVFRLLYILKKEQHNTESETTLGRA